MEKEGNPRRVVEELRANKFGIGVDGMMNNPLARDMHESIRHLAAELYQKDIHFVMELVQNADDNTYGDGVVPKMEFVLVEADVLGVGVEWTLAVLNNEVGFSRANVESLCSVGLSTKKGKRDTHGYIGEKGIGFKSVFLITRHPVVISNGYRIRFHDAPTETSELGFIVPEWADHPTNPELAEFLNLSEDELPTTVILLPIREDKVQAMREQLFQLSPQLVLFLKKIEKLSVRQLSRKASVRDMSVQRHITPLPRECARLIDNDCTYSLVRLSSVGKETVYHVWQQEFPVNEDHELDQRRHVRSWMVSLAFPLKDDYKDVDLFSFLPTKMTVGLPFIINADFLLVSSRDNIRFDSKWNKGILSCVSRAFISAFLFLLHSANTLAEHTTTIKSIYRYIPCENLRVRELASVRDEIIQQIKCQNTVLLDRNIGQHFPGVHTCKTRLDILTTSGSGPEMNFFCKPSMAFSIDSDFRALLQSAHKEGIPPPAPLTSQKFYIVDSQLEKGCHKVLTLIGVQPLTWDRYVNCVRDHKWVENLPEPLYVKLLVFLCGSQKQKHNMPSDVPFIKYLDDGKVMQMLKLVNKDRTTVFYTSGDKDVSILSQWTPVFKKWIDVRFMPNDTIQAIKELDESKSSELFRWLEDVAGIFQLTVQTYADKILKLCGRRQEEAIALNATHFLLHACKEYHLSAKICSVMSKKLPLVDSKAGVVVNFKGPVLLPGSVCIWPKILVNGSWKREAVFLSELYLKPPSFMADQITESVIIQFLKEVLSAVDIFQVKDPPNAQFFIPCPSELPANDVKSLLGWLQTLAIIPHKLRSTFQDVEWVRTVEHGSKRPSATFLDTGKWINVLTPRDVPFVDKTFYEDLSPFSRVLSELGMVTEVEKGAKAVAAHIEELSRNDFTSVHSDTAIRWYTYLRQQNWTSWLYNPQMRSIWVPSGKGNATLGFWSCAEDCVINDSEGLFHNRLVTLERYYKDPDILKFFKENMGVASSPGMEKYCSLWQTWSVTQEGKVSRKNCENVWYIIAIGWKTFASKPSSELNRFLKQSRIPCSGPVDDSKDGDTIIVARPNEVVYADNLILKEIFASSCPSLKFAWYPRTAASVSWIDELVKTYTDLGVKLLSDVVSSGSSKISCKPIIKAQERKIIGKGMYRTILGYLGDPKLKLSAPARKRMVMELCGVEVCRVDQIGEVEYTVRVDGKQLVAKRTAHVRWEKADKCIYLGSPLSMSSKSQIVHDLADEVAKGVVGAERVVLVEGLREMLFSAASFHFDDEEVQYLLLRSNLHLSLEDEALLQELNICGGGVISTYY